MDYYLNQRNVVNRLVTEWEQHKKLVIAYDFDNTVFDFHKQGHTYHDVIQLLRDCNEYGAYLVVFTAREDEELPELIQYLEENQIPFDAVNENLDFLPFKGRKIYYNILLDDRAGLKSSYKALKEALLLMKHKVKLKQWTSKWQNYIEENRLKFLFDENGLYELLKGSVLSQVSVISNSLGEDKSAQLQIEKSNIKYSIRKNRKQKILRNRNKMIRFLDCWEIAEAREDGKVVTVFEDAEGFEVLNSFMLDEIVHIYDEE